MGDRGSIAHETPPSLRLFQVAKPCREQFAASRIWAALGPGLDLEISWSSFLGQRESQLFWTWVACLQGHEAGLR